MRLFPVLLHYHGSDVIFETRFSRDPYPDVPSVAKLT